MQNRSRKIRQYDNITKCLLKTGEASNTLGDDEDIHNLLGNHISNPDAVKIESNKAYIFPPTAIVSSRIEARYQNAADLVMNQIKPVLEKSKNKQNVKALVPVNSGQSHWLLFAVDMSDGKIEKARLIDSMHGMCADMKDKLAYKTAQVVVNRLANSNVIVVEPVMTQKQSNGVSCMDYSVQEALIIKANHNNEVLSAGLTKMVDAKNSAALREAVVEQIASTKPEIRKKRWMTETARAIKPKTNKWEEFVRLVHEKEQNDKAINEPKINYFIAEKEEYKQVQVTTTSQVELDEELARRLHAELNPEANDEEYAKQLQNQYDEENRRVTMR